MMNVNEDLSHTFFTLFVKKNAFDRVRDITEIKLCEHGTIHKFFTRDICLNIQITGKF